jgi:hypothetical protein
VGGVVIDTLDPRREQLVEPGQVSDFVGIDLNEELLAHGAKDPLDLPPAFWLSGQSGPGESRAVAGWHRLSGLVGAALEVAEDLLVAADLGGDGFEASA